MRIRIDTERVVWRTLKDELVLLHLETGAYYTLNETGALIWQGLVDGRPYPDIIAAITAAYEVDERAAQQDFERLVNELASQGMVELVDDDVGAKHGTL